jgi:hypothetical protein
MKIYKQGLLKGKVVASLAAGTALALASFSVAVNADDPPSKRNCPTVRPPLDAPTAAAAPPINADPANPPMRPRGDALTTRCDAAAAAAGIPTDYCKDKELNSNYPNSNPRSYQYCNLVGTPVLVQCPVGKVFESDPRPYGHCDFP